MMIKTIVNIIVVIALAVAVTLISGAVYILPETKQAVITQFGMPVGDPIVSPGMHFKVPFIQKANLFEKRLLEWDGDSNQIPTRDKKYIWVDTTARWKISDALRFLQSVGSERGAQARLDDIVNSATRDVVTRHLLVETIRDSNRILIEKEEGGDMALAEEALEEVASGRQDLEAEILAGARVLAPQYGIDLVDVRIKRINYVEEVREKVYERMISERERAAAQYRSEGQGKSAEIRGQKEKELKLITSGAYRKAQKIRGDGDAEAISIYASAYNKDPDFYSFTKTLETYKDTVGPGSTMVLTTDSDYYKYVKQQK